MSVSIALPAKYFRAAPRARFADFANRRTAADYDTVVCTTGFAREEFDRIGATNTVTIPLGVDLETFHPSRRSALVRQRWATPTQILLVHCGRLSVEKRADRSIDAVAALCDAGVEARLVVVGDGPLRARLQRQAARLPVDFTGFISDRHSVAELLASADVALAPGPHETFGLAALEALACGTPAVVSRTSALGEIITAGKRRAGRQQPDSDRRGRHRGSPPPRSASPRLRAPTRRDVHLATGRGRDAEHARGRGVGGRPRRLSTHRLAAYPELAGPTWPVNGLTCTVIGPPGTCLPCAAARCCAAWASALTTGLFFAISRRSSSDSS